MPRIGQDQEAADDRTPERVVVDRARCYEEARREAERLHRDRILAGEEERLAECEAHAEANHRIATVRERDDLTMGFTGTGGAPSDGDRPDPRSGRSHLRHQGLVVERKRLEALCDRADRQMEEAHGALLAAAGALVSAEAAEESDGEGPEAGFDVLRGEGEDAEVRSVEPDGEHSVGESSAA